MIFFYAVFAALIITIFLIFFLGRTGILHPIPEMNKRFFDRRFLLRRESDRRADEKFDLFDRRSGDRERRANERRMSERRESEK